MRRYYLQMGALGLAVVVEAWRLELTRSSPQNSAWLLYLKGINALPTARNSNEVAKVWSPLRCYPHTGNGGFIGNARNKTA